MNDRLEYKLKRLCREDVVDWAGERTVQRAEGYLDRVGEIFALDDFIAAKVRGTEEYTTNVFLDKYGEWNSVCTCPVRMNCKHGVALALCAATRKARRSVSTVTTLSRNTRGHTSPHLHLLRRHRRSCISRSRRTRSAGSLQRAEDEPSAIHFE